MIYRFESFELDTERFQLREAGRARQVEPQVLALLELLVANAGRLVTKDELNQRVWGGRVVSDAVVNSRVRSARQAVGDDGAAQRLIETVRGRGFRFAVVPQVENTALTVERYAGPGPARPPADPAAAPSIAVLPFQPAAEEPRLQVLADAVAHELIVELSRLHWLFVIARGSSFRFRGPDVDLAAAARVLGVRYLLTGSIALEGRRSLVTVELIEAADGRVRWADSIEGPVDDLMALRQTIAARVVTALELRIPALEAGRAAGVPTENLDAWSAYHRGLWHMFRFNGHDNAIAAQLFDRAIATDPSFARAHAGRSFTHFQNAFVGYARDAAGERRLARASAERSMQLDPLDPFGNLTMGRALMLAGDMGGAQSWFDRAVELNPNFALAIYNRALADAVCGAGEAGEQGAMKALRLSPIDPLRYAMLATRGLSHIVRGEHEAAKAWAERATGAPNAHVHIRAIAALACGLAGDAAGAQRWASVIREDPVDFRQATFFEAFPFRDEATRAAAKRVFDRLGL